MNKTIVLITLTALAFTAGAATSPSDEIERYRWVAYKGRPLKRDLSKLELFNGTYPSVLVFRPVEIGLRGGILISDDHGKTVLGRDRSPISYEEFERLCLPMVGINYKVLNEEVIVKPQVFDYAKRFKKDHSEKALILHYNGRARLPRTVPAGRYSNGHWLYRVGTVCETDVPAECGFTRIKVKNMEPLAIGKLAARSNADLVGTPNGIHAVLYQRHADGTPDWTHSEQVILQAGNVNQREVVLQRGCFGSKPLRFKGGTCYLAPHYTVGPYDNPRIYFWAYNFSTAGPKDPNGKTARDIYAEELYSYFAPRGVCETFDGVEFDAAYNHYFIRGDFDNNGEVDNGLIDGANVAVEGRRIMDQKIRTMLGPDFIILADARTPSHTRGFDILNGMESESWPAKQDEKWLRTWSSGINRHLFWDRRSFAPVYNYFNTVNNHMRLTEAAAVMVNAGVTSSFYKDSSGQMHVWSDEMMKGSSVEPGWLGKPLEPAHRLALDAPDLLLGAGQKEFRFQPSETLTETKFITSQLTVGDIPLTGAKEVFIWLTVQADEMKTASGKIPRALWVSLEQANDQLPDDVRYDSQEKNGRLKKTEHFPFVQEAWADEKETAYGFYFRWIDTDRATLRVEIEGHGPAIIKNVSAHAAPDVMVRRFEHGAVVANPSLQSMELNRQNLLGTDAYQTINETKIGNTLLLAPLDAAFLIKE